MRQLVDKHLSNPPGPRVKQQFGSCFRSGRCTHRPRMVQDLIVTSVLWVAMPNARALLVAFLNVADDAFAADTFEDWPKGIV